MKKLLPKRKPERKPSDEEFAVRKSECPPHRGVWFPVAFAPPSRPMT